MAKAVDRHLSTRLVSRSNYRNYHQQRCTRARRGKLLVRFSAPLPSPSLVSYFVKIIIVNIVSDTRLCVPSKKKGGGGRKENSKWESLFELLYTVGSDIGKIQYVRHSKYVQGTPAGCVRPEISVPSDGFARYGTHIFFSLPLSTFSFSPFFLFFCSSYFFVARLFRQNLQSSRRYAKRRNAICRIALFSAWFASVAMNFLSWQASVFACDVVMRLDARLIGGTIDILEREKERKRVSERARWMGKGRRGREMEERAIIVACNY